MSWRKAVAMHRWGFMAAMSLAGKQETLNNRRKTTISRVPSHHHRE